MSVAVMESLRQWLNSANLLDGYDVKFNRWTDADEQGSANFVMFRIAGPGVSNRIEQRYDIDFYMVADASYVSTQNRINQIAEHLNAVAQPPGVVRYSVPGNPTGPFELSNGRQVFKLAVFAYDSVDLPA